jgi:probable rRNA maturation factor
MTGSFYLPPWRIDVAVRDGVELPITQVALARAIGRTLDAAAAPHPASVGLILTDDREIAELNAAHLGERGATDVLSFPLLPPEAYPDHPGKAPSSGSPAFVLPRGRRQHLGDIVVSVERAVEQAERGRGGQTGGVSWAPADELRLLVTHGALHLCGWDHAAPTEESAMRALEYQLLEG